MNSPNLLCSPCQYELFRKELGLLPKFTDLVFTDSVFANYVSPSSKSSINAALDKVWTLLFDEDYKYLSKSLIFSPSDAPLVSQFTTIRAGMAPIKSLFASPIEFFLTAELLSLVQLSMTAAIIKSNPSILIQFTKLTDSPRINTAKISEYFTTGFTLFGEPFYRCLVALHCCEYQLYSLMGLHGETDISEYRWNVGDTLSSDPVTSNCESCSSSIYLPSLFRRSSTRSPVMELPASPVWINFLIQECLIDAKWYAEMVNSSESPTEPAKLSNAFVRTDVIALVRNNPMLSFLTALFPRLVNTYQLRDVDFLDILSLEWGVRFETYG